ncbi:MAG TPA: hypothetical protein VFG69_08260 [Nannocystaceae bacterium]|nr:hypothetical protein [Nannocystaceae bacterium]
MAITTPFLDLEDHLFGRDRGFLERIASRFVLATATTVARKRVSTERYRVVTRQPPASAEGDSQVVRSNEPALVLASRASAA